MINASKYHFLWLAAGVVLGWGTSTWVKWARQQLLQWLWPLGPLKLQRPLVAFDIEATGLNVSRDRIVEIAAVKVLPSGRVVVKGPQRLNPGIPIPAEVTAIHNISQEHLVHCPKFSEVAADWKDFLEGCDLLGYNAKKFDVPMLRNEFRRCGHFNTPPLGVPVVDAFRVFCSKEPRTLSAAVKYYCGRTYSKEDAHSALGDAWATLRVMVEQARRYTDLPSSISQLAEWCSRPGKAQDITPDGKFQWRGDQPIVAFGKHHGEPLAVLIARHRDHLMWMSGQDLPDETLILVDHALKGQLPTKAGGWEPLFDTPPPDTQQAADLNSRFGPADSSRNGSRRRQQQQQQPPVQEDSNTNAAASSSNNSNEATTEAATAAAGGFAAIDAAAGDAAGASGWPVMDAAADAEAAGNPDSWGADPAAIAAVTAAAAESAAAAAVVDGWSLLETSSGGDGYYFENNPEPQHTADEPEEDGLQDGHGDNVDVDVDDDDDDDDDDDGSSGFKPVEDAGALEDVQQQMVSAAAPGDATGSHDDGYGLLHAIKQHQQQHQTTDVVIQQHQQQHKVQAKGAEEQQQQQPPQPPQQQQQQQQQSEPSGARGLSSDDDGGPSPELRIL